MYMSLPTLFLLAALSDERFQSQSIIMCVCVCVEGSEELQQVEGNEFRDVWKASCWQMLHEVMMTSFTLN